METSFLSRLSGLVGGARMPNGAVSVRAATHKSGATQVGTNDPQTGIPTKTGYLSAMYIFQDMSPKEMQMIDASTVMTTAPKGKIIYMPGETGEVLFLLKKGSVHLYRLSSEGRKLIIHTVGPMTFFGEMAIVGQNMHDLFAEAAEDCLVCVMSRSDVERLLVMKPQVALRMLEEIGQRMHYVHERLGDSAFKGIPARIASLLVKLSCDCTLPITGVRHQDFADMLGIYRETVSNTLGSLRDEGIIEMSRKEISIVDTERLREISEEELLRRR